MLRLRPTSLSQFNRFLPGIIKDANHKNTNLSLPLIVGKEENKEKKCEKKQSTREICQIRENGFKPLVCSSPFGVQDATAPTSTILLHMQAAVGFDGDWMIRHTILYFFILDTDAVDHAVVNARTDGDN